jgi:hypothetical protein
MADQGAPQISKQMKVRGPIRAGRRRLIGRIRNFLMHLIDSLAQWGVVLFIWSISCRRDVTRSKGIPSTILGMMLLQNEAEVNLVLGKRGNHEKTDWVPRY